MEKVTVVLLAGLNVAGLVFDSLAHAVSPSMLGLWISALAAGELNTPAAAPRTGTPGAPLTPPSIHWHLQHKRMNHVSKRRLNWNGLDCLCGLFEGTVEPQT